MWHTLTWLVTNSSRKKAGEGTCYLLVAPKIGSGKKKLSVLALRVNGENMGNSGKKSLLNTQILIFLWQKNWHVVGLLSCQL